MFMCDRQVKDVEACLYIHIVHPYNNIIQGKQVGMQIIFYSFNYIILLYTYYFSFILFQVHHEMSCNSMHTYEKLKEIKEGINTLVSPKISRGGCPCHWLPTNFRKHWSRVDECAFNSRKNANKSM